MAKPLATTKVQGKEKLKERIDPISLISNRHTSKSMSVCFNTTIYTGNALPS